MKLGICYPYRLTTEAALDLVATCDQRGLDSVWIVENAGWPGAFATAGAVAAITRQISVSIGVVSAFTRLPTVIAMEAAQVQRLAAGRFRLGLGVGSKLADVGVDASHPVDGIAETVTVVRSLLSGGIREHRGKRHTVRNFDLAFEFGDAPPIHIGTVGPKMTALAGRISDGVILTTHAPTALMTQTIGTARDAVRESGRPRDAFHVTAFVVACVRRDRAEARHELRPRLASDLSRMVRNVPSMAPLFHSVGLDDDKLRALADAPRPAELAHLLDDAVVDALCFAGDAAALGARLTELKSIGVDEVVLFDAAEDHGFGEQIDGLVAAARDLRSS